VLQRFESFRLKFSRSCFLSVLKERLKEELQQEDMLIVERDVETL
jgi:hypothetical protein